MVMYPLIHNFGIFFPSSGYIIRNTDSWKSGAIRTGRNAGTTKHWKNLDGLKITIYPEGANILINLPVLVGKGDNLSLGDKDDLITCKKKIRNELSPYLKLISPIGSATINRIDITKDIFLDFPFGFYLDGIYRLRYPRMELIIYPDGTGVLFKNKGKKGKSLLLYDKARELEKQDINIEESHVLRCELQLKGSTTVKKEDLTTFDGIIDGYPLLYGIHFKHFERLFRSYNEPLPSTSENHLKLIAEVGWQKAMKYLAWELTAGIDKEQLRSALSVKSSQPTVYTQLQKREVYLNDNPRRMTMQRSSYPTLLSELKDKVLSEEECPVSDYNYEKEADDETRG